MFPYSRWHCASKNPNKTQNPIKPDKTQKNHPGWAFLKNGFFWNMFQVLGLGLVAYVLGLGLGLESKVLGLGLVKFSIGLLTPQRRKFLWFVQRPFVPILTRCNNASGAFLSQVWCASTSSLAWRPSTGKVAIWHRLLGLCCMSLALALRVKSLALVLASWLMSLALPSVSLTPSLAITVTNMKVCKIWLFVQPSCSPGQYAYLHLPLWPSCIIQSQAEGGDIVRFVKQLQVQHSLRGTCYLI